MSANVHLEKRQTLAVNGRTRRNASLSHSLVMWLAPMLVMLSSALATAAERPDSYLTDYGPFYEQDGTLCAAAGLQGQAEGRWIYYYCYSATVGVWFAVVEPLLSAQNPQTR